MAKKTANKGITAGYIRVSSAKQRDESESPANQRVRLKKAGATQIFEDLAVSGFRKASRKKAAGWANLWKAIEDGQITRLIACRLDRYGRRDSLVMELAEHCEANGCSFETLASGAVDLSNPSNRIGVKVELMMAEFYSRQLSSNIRAAHKAAIDRKVVAFTSKHLGWQLRRIEGTKHGVEKHPERWDDARTAVMNYINGEWSMEQCSNWIYDRHRIMKTTASLLKWLHSHNIRGHYGRRDGPVLIVDAFPALINQEESDQLERRLKANSRKRSATRAPHYTYPLSGIAKCSCCGTRLNYSCVAKANGETYHYLRCPSRKGHCDVAGVRIPADLVEESMVWHLEQIALSHDVEPLQQTPTKPAKASREVSEAKRRLRKLEVLLEEGEDPDLRAAYERQEVKLAELEGKGQEHQQDDLAALIRRLSIGSASWYFNRSFGERNGIWLQALDGLAAVDLSLHSRQKPLSMTDRHRPWLRKLTAPVFRLKAA